MDSRKASICEKNVEKKDKRNWISRLIKSTIPSKQKSTVHCSDYSSVICLRCDKCWAIDSKPVKEPK